MLCILLLGLVVEPVLLVSVSCPLHWWYCLNRDPKDTKIVKATDVSRRSISWTWDTNTGTWNIAYNHTFTNGYYGVKACFADYRGTQPACVSYSSQESWKSNKLPIQANGWDIAYNGDSFGFQPIRAAGQYIFHIFSRNLHYCPFEANDGEVPPNQYGPYLPEDIYNCREIPRERTEGDGWWLERKSLRKCPIKVNRPGWATSPKELSWNTEAGSWKVTYAWSIDMVKCQIDYTKNKFDKKNIIKWEFNKSSLVLKYNSQPIQIFDESGWKLMIARGEAWGFIPSLDGTWIFPIFSRNVIVRPFRRASGIVNFQSLRKESNLQSIFSLSSIH